MTTWDRGIAVKKDFFNTLQNQARICYLTQGNNTTNSNPWKTIK